MQELAEQLRWWWLNHVQGNYGSTNTQLAKELAAALQLRPVLNRKFSMQDVARVRACLPLSLTEIIFL